MGIVDSRATCQEILNLLESRIHSDPAKPVMSAGEMIRELKLNKNEFYKSIGILMEYKRVGELREGRKHYFFLQEMIDHYKDK
jgi:hypothetical protein